jgi:clan AA aspartic protease
MAQTKKVVSLHFPYLPVEVVINQNNRILEALLDTGFDGYIVLPPKLVTNGEVADLYESCKLADNSIVRVPIFLGSVRLGSKKLNNITFLIMGDEPIIGRSVVEHFKITLDHGKKIILEQ